MINFLPLAKPEAPARPQPKLSEHEPKEFFLNIAARLKKENESERAKEQAQTIYQMCRRHRGQTFNDLFAFWNNGVWCESPMFSGLHGTNVFQMLVRGAEANYCQIDIRLDIKANRNNAETRAAVKLSRSIYEILKEKQWTETAKQSEFYAKILKLNAFYISRFDKSKGTNNVSMPQYEEVQYEEGGTYICPECYSTGDYSFQNTQKCPECQNETLSVMDEPQNVKDYLVNGFDQIKGGETELVIADGLDVSVDPDGRPADIKSCKWVEWRYPAQKSELKRLYPHLKLESKTEWSYQMRLKMGLKRYSAGEAYPVTDFDKSTYEVRQIWLDLTEYEEYVPPVNARIGNFVFTRGVAIKEQCPNGLVFLVVGNELACIDPENKNKRVSASLWLSDGVSFAGLGAKAGLMIQKKINHLDNMAMEGEARSLKGSVIYDSTAVDGASLEGANTNIPLKLDYSVDSQKGIAGAVLPLQVEGLSQYSLMYLAGQKQTMQEVMGVPDVTLGQDTATDKTFGGQALRSRNATGLLVPATQSTARAMELWLSHQLDLIKEFYAPEALYNFGALYGSEWMPDEIEAFFNCDFDNDITIAYQPGSEVPESRYDKQMRLRQDIANGFITMTPELQAQIARESHYDGMDVNNYESNLKLGEKRWNFLKERVAQDEKINAAFQMYEQMLVDPASGMRLTDETGNPVPNPVLTQLLNQPEFKIYNTSENHPQMVEFWADKVRELASGAEQSPLLIETASAMVARHNQAIFELGMKQQTLAGLAGMPSAAGQKMLAEGDKEQNESR